MWLLWLLMAAGSAPQSVQEAFRAYDPSLTQFRIGKPKKLDATRSVMFASASPTPTYNSDDIKIGIFVVNSATNRLERTVDIFANPPSDPSFERTGPGFVNVSYYTEYGSYEGSTKYFLNPARKFPYHKPVFTSSLLQDRKLVLTGEEVQIEVPGFKVTQIPLVARGPSPEPPIYEPVPIPTPAEHLKYRHAERSPEQIENQIGPFVEDGSTIWFANSFYNGEGQTGVGAIGSYDKNTAKFTMRYLPEIVDWSGSAMSLDGDNLWIGLMIRPEGAELSGGLLRYNTKTGTVVKYKVADVITTIGRLGNTIYCGTSDGIYMIRGRRISQVRFEPDRDGKLTVVK